MVLPKILLVDDDPEDRVIITEAMTAIIDEMVIAVAENGEQALAMLHDEVATGSVPCLVVLDLNMPKMGGVETLKHLKHHEQLRHIPVIIFSTSINPLEQERCMQLGAHSYIIKPVSFKESLETARLFLAFCTAQSTA